MIGTLLQTFIALFSAAAGAILAAFLGVSHRNLCALISFAAGALLAVTFGDIIPEALTQVSLPAIAFALVSGYLLFSIIGKYVFHVCPACAASHFDEHSGENFNQIAVMLGIAFGIHSVMDGIALALGEEFAKTANLSIFLTITIHKFPEGLALCALLLGSAPEKKIRAIFLALAFETSTLAGWLLGAFVIRGSEINRWFPLILLHIGGGFIYLAFHAILGERKKHSSKRIMAWCLAGILIIWASHFLHFGS